VEKIVTIKGIKSHMKVGQNWWEKRVNFQRESSLITVATKTLLRNHLSRFGLGLKPLFVTNFKTGTRNSLEIAYEPSPLNTALAGN
jgi:hypothetical protein